MEAILVVVSRTFLLDQIIDWLNVNCPIEAKYAFYCDNEPQKNLIESKISRLDRKNIEIYHSGRKPHQNYGRTRDRRVRIAEVWNDIIQWDVLHLKESKTLFSIEDDTLPPQGAYQRLKSLLVDADLVTGIEVGRWGIKHLGLWEYVESNVTKLSSLPIMKGVVEIDACGLYCFIAHTGKLKGVDITGTHEAYGPDVELTLGITENGGRIVADFETPCEHHDEYGKVLVVEEPIEIFSYVIKDGKYIAQGTSINIEHGTGK